MENRPTAANPVPQWIEVVTSPDVLRADLVARSATRAAGGPGNN